jgi:serine/threonine protein phosphatase 1
MLLGSLGHSAVVSDTGTWLYNGGYATLLSYGLGEEELGRLQTLWDEHQRQDALLKLLPEAHMNFYLDTKLHVETEGYFFCHAGVHPALSIAEGKHNAHNLLWMREHLYADDPRWEKTLVCGHTPLREIHITEKLICIDTGLHYFGKLTAIDVKSRKIFQVGLE